MTKRANIIAVVGKGGTGKTVIASLLLKFLIEDGTAGRVLAIDADPAASLPSTLGVSVNKTIGDVREERAAPGDVFFSEHMPTDMLIEYKTLKAQPCRPIINSEASALSIGFHLSIILHSFQEFHYVFS